MTDQHTVADSLVVRGRVAPSRVMFGPHETNLGNGRCFSDRHAAYYARRARGGAGIVVLEEASVHPSDWPYELAPLASACAGSWRAVTDSIRLATIGSPTDGAASGAPGDGAASGIPLVLAGIGHSGGQGTSHWSQRELWAPSGVPEVSTREVPKVMEIADIDAVVDGFANAARIAVESGLDGVEVNMGQYSLVRQFASGLTNMRADEYGSDRLLFARRVLGAVRDAAGDAVVGLRLSCDELAPWAGIVPDAAVAIAVELAPFVDLLTVVRGSIFSAALTRPDGHVEPGFNIGLAQQVRAGLRAAGHEIPVVAQGSIVDVGQADWAIQSGAADAAEMTRALLADAALVSKYRAGLSARIRPCVLCNQTCKVRDNRNPIVTCVVDPSTGFETVDPDTENVTRPPIATGDHLPPVHVAGGGVAGLEFARVAAQMGRAVTVHERSSQFGGAVRAAANGAGRARLALIAEWLEAECRQLGVQLLANQPVDEQGRVAGVARPVDLVATGGVAAAVPFVVGAGAVVIDATEVLRGAGIPDGIVAVWDPLGGPVGISVAERLAADGRTVVLITPDLLVGEKLALSGDLAPSQGRLHGAGIRLVKRALVRSVDPGTIVVEDRFTAARSTIDAAVLVTAHHRVPDCTVDPDETLVHAGDRVAPRTVLEAIREGRAAAVALCNTAHVG